ncbi:hypothetical protein [Sphingomonas sp. UV9]|uniref:hypothetical protein n=1 Tax=Sphingomonas sp. UV9 TaxID=1851410 RepID=UPI001F0C8103|nr:hypothetical protein [Sphingomonas sp. UV9]
MIRPVARTALLRSGRDEASDTMVDLKPGDSFEVLEIAGVSAWGVARPSGLVGYVATDALDLSTDLAA